MSNCPTCGDNFDTDRAMKIHHSQAHDKSIAKKDTECKECRTAFEYYPSEKDGIYCPDCVRNGVNRNIERIPNDLKHTFSSGKNNVNYSGGEKKDCDNCDGDVWVSPSGIENKSHHFCKAKCYREWWSKECVGEGNPNWRGGYDEEYGEGWWRARRLTLERDNYTCQKCGSLKSTNGRNCDVHHKQPVRTFDNPSNAHGLDNLVTLCRSCHMEEEYSDRKI